MGFDLVGFIISAFCAVAAGGICWCALQSAGRMVYVTLADGQRLERRIPVLFRILLPFSPNLAFLFDRPMFERTKRKLNRTLVACGLDEVMTASDFLALRVLVPIVLGLVLVFILWRFLPMIPGRVGRFVLHQQWVSYMIAVLLAVNYPMTWLRQTLAQRHRNLQRALPFILDLLTLSVEAGMDFMSAIQRIVIRRKLDPLGEELFRVMRAIQLGKTRREALREMADRVDQSDVRSVTNALVQADEMGVSIGAILRIQSDQIRVRRFQRAEKLAHEAPVKMLFPLIAFIFPAVFFVLLGPVFLEMARQWL